MVFAVKSIFSFILSKNLNLKQFKWFSVFLPKKPYFKQPHHLLPKIYSYPSKLLVCLLCLNVFLFSTYHVVCLELFNEGISKSHLQLYECDVPQDNEPGINLHNHNQKDSHIVLADLLGTTPSCPECIDEHIQFVKSSAGIYLDTAILMNTFLLTTQSNTPQLFFAAENSSVPLEHSFPLSSFRSSVIRSTILLI